MQPFIIELPTWYEYSSEVEGGEVANRHSVLHKHLVGRSSRSWISPCMEYAAKDGGLYWVFKDEVSAPMYADIRRGFVMHGKA